MAKSYDLDEIEETQIDAAARELQQRIDRSVMISLLEESGWYRIDSIRIIENPALDSEVVVWAKENKILCLGQDGTYVFKRQQDAVLFTLKWS